MGIEEKIEQMYAALEAMQITERLALVRPEIKRVGKDFAVSFDFKKGATAPIAANRVSQLVANIACLKDHLRVWCERNGKPFTGDNLIDSNRDVAIVHDLWNLDKHGKLSRSRSGLFPKTMYPPHSAVVLKGGEAGAVTIPVFGGPIQARGSASLRIVASVLDKDGNPLGELEDICEKAVAAWEAEFNKAGLTF